MTAELLARLAGPCAAGGLAVLLLATPRWARLTGLAAWAGGLALFVPFLAPGGRAGTLVAALVAGAALGAAVAAALRRWPWALAFLALAAVPARLPVSFVDTSANLLLPLYAVVGAGALALSWSLWRDPPRARELGLVSWPVAALVAWISLSALWSDDVHEAAIELFFFVLPFPVLALALARLPWSERALGSLARMLGAMALVFAAVGGWQWATRDLFWNPKVIAGNAYAPFYRVNSVFWDPSIYGRFLDVAILTALAFLLFGIWRRWDLALGVLVVVVWAGLLLSFSQSSFVALFAGILLAAAIAWRWRAAAALGLVAVVMIAVGFAAPEFHRVRESVTAHHSGLNRVTQGRFGLASGGIEIALDHPVTGVGVGGFGKAFLDSGANRQGMKDPESHTALVTAAAETGLIGLALFVWVVAAGLALAFRRTRSASVAIRLAGLVAGICFAAIFVHSLFYSAFLEDPLTWVFLALAANAANAATAANPS